MASPLAHPRVGIVVAKRRSTTTDRNRLKRRLRELVRIDILPGLGSVDVVIHARREAYDASFAELRAHLTEGVKRVTSALNRSGSVESL